MQRLMRSAPRMAAPVLPIICNINRNVRDDVNATSAPDAPKRRKPVTTVAFTPILRGKYVVASGEKTAGTVEIMPSILNWNGVALSDAAAKSAK